MNDDELESALRGMIEPPLPEEWRAPILARARTEAARRVQPRATWPPLLVGLSRLFVRNPVTASALTALWLLILLLKAGTPDDPPAERLLARAGALPPNRMVPLSEQLRLVALLKDEADPPAPERP